MAETFGNLTKVGIGAGAGATTFDPICVFGGEAIVDFGAYSINKEYCLTRKEAFVALNDLEFTSVTYSYLWGEDGGDPADAIIKAAHDADEFDAKVITVQIEVNNSIDGVLAGTLYTADFLVTGYKHMFTKGAVNKSEFTIEQLTMPVETPKAIV